MLSGDGGPSPYQTHLQARTHFQLQLQQPRYFSPAKRLWKVWRLILLLPQKSNKCWNVTFCSYGNESFVVVFLFDSKHKQSSIAAYLHCFSPAPHKLCWAPTVYSHFDSATICQSHETHNCSPIHSVNTLFKKSSLWGDQLNHKESEEILKIWLICSLFISMNGKWRLSTFFFLMFLFSDHNLAVMSQRRVSLFSFVFFWPKRIIAQYFSVWV